MPAAVELRDFLAARLPDYMVLAAYRTVGELPRTSSGKLSRRLLPRPDEEAEWAGRLSTRASARRCRTCGGSG